MEVGLSNQAALSILEHPEAFKIPSHAFYSKTSRPSRPTDR